MDKLSLAGPGDFPPAGMNTFITRPEHIVPDNIEILRTAKESLLKEAVRKLLIK